MKDFLFAIGIIVGLAVAAAVTLVYWGWAVSLLWGWFIVPLGVKPLSLAAAIGMSLLAKLLVVSPDFKTEEPSWPRIAGVYASPLLAVGIGYLLSGL